MSDDRKHKFSPRVSGKKTITEVLTAFYTQVGRRKPVLTDKQEQIRQRLVSMNALLLEGYTTDAAVKVLQNKYGITHMQGYRDFHACIALFGNVGAAEKEGQRYLVGEMAKKTFEVAMSKSDSKGMAMALKVMIDTYQLNSTDADLPDFARLDPGVIVLALPEAQQSQLEKMLSKGVVDFNHIEAEEAIVVPEQRE